MKVAINGDVCEVDNNLTLKQALEQYSPYGTEALICHLNGEVVKSIDDALDVTLAEGDTLDMYPLVIGG